jgi:outer membrane protein assembly factor BamB
VGIKHNRRLLAKVWLLLVVLLIVGVTVSGCYGRAQTVGWSGVIIADDTLFITSVDGNLIALNTSDGGSRWKEPLGTSNVAVYGTPAVAGDLVYVGGYNGKVYSISSSLGTKRQVYPVDANLQPIVSGVVVDGGRVYFGCSDGKVYALNAAELYKEWESPTGGKIWSTPVIDGETIYVGSFDKKLYALNATDGSKKWEFETGGAIVATPLVYNNTVYVGAFDRHLYAVDATSGSLRWRSEVEAGKWYWAKPVAYNNVIYAPNLDGKVYILDANSGREVVGAVDLESPISSSPVVVDGRVIIASQEGGVYSLDASNNQVSLLRNVGDGEKIYAPLCASNGVIYVHTRNSKEDTLYALNAQTGVEVWRPVPLTSE